MPMKQSLTAEIIRDLERQGARIENARTGRKGMASDSTNQLRFPVKIFPPNGSPMFTIHQTVGDWRHERTLDTVIRRAGLRSMLSPDRPEKETEVSETQTAANQPLKHERVPAGAISMRSAPMQVTLDTLQPALAKMPHTFWTDELIAMIRGLNIPGYNSGAAGVRLQGLLDFMGYRVTESRPNRGGYSYRWVFDPNAEKRQPAQGNAIVTSIHREPAHVSVAEAIAAAEQQPIVVKPSHPSFSHVRVTCEECGKTFTSDAYARHVADTGHNEPEETVSQGDIEPEPAVVSQDDYDAMEQMAAEAEQRASEANELVQQQDRLLMEAKRITEQQQEALERTVGELQQQITAKESALELVQDLREELALTRAKAEQTPAADSDSWEVTPDRTQTLEEIELGAKIMGLVVSVWARRA